MKGYVVTLLNLPQSVDIANRCVQSAKQFGIDVEIFPGVYKDISLNEAEKENLMIAVFDQSYSNLDAVVGNFVSQYRIWHKILQSNQPGIVLEHDAVFVSHPLNLTDRGDIINLGKPSYGKFNTKNQPGIYPMFSKDGGYIPGAHGYYVTPNGAEQLISTAKRLGISPCDIFLNKTNFPNIKEVQPWPIICDDYFSSIQREKGCIAKHNFNQKYKLL